MTHNQICDLISERHTLPSVNVDISQKIIDCSVWTNQFELYQNNNKMNNPPTNQLTFNAQKAFGRVQLCLYVF